MSEGDYRTLSAIVMLGGAKFPNDDALGRAIHERLPDVLVEASRDQHNALLFFACGAMCTVMKVAAPCPISQEDATVMTAWHWPQAWASLKSHTAHMIVSVSGEIDPRIKTKLLGQLTAAVVETSPSAIAVHWASADVLWPAKALPVIVPAREEKLPVPLCVAVKMSRDVDDRTKRPSGTISGMTRGLAAFGLMEIETRGYGGDPRALNGTLLDLASYLIEAGPVLKDGDTIGPDEATKIIVRHEQSGFVPEQAVYRLYFPQPGHVASSAGK
jgi:hypothetical protein